jgi:hypothetical protein
VTRREGEGREAGRGAPGLALESVRCLLAPQGRLLERGIDVPQWVIEDRGLLTREPGFELLRKPSRAELSSLLGGCSDRRWAG